MFLFSATFYPITAYPPALQTLVEITPLYQGVDLIRSLTVGAISPILLFHVAYLLVMGFAGLFVVSRRLDKLLLKYGFAAVVVLCVVGLAGYGCGRRHTGQLQERAKRQQAEAELHEQRASAREREVGDN